MPIFGHKGQLDIPPVAKQDGGGVEIARVWAAEGSQHVSLRPDIWDDPFAWSETGTTPVLWADNPKTGTTPVLWAEDGSTEVLIVVHFEKRGLSPFRTPFRTARASEFGHGAALAMSVVDNIPIADIGLAASEGIDAIQEEKRQAAAEARREEEQLLDDLFNVQREASDSCGCAK